jgi:arylsulfatase A-like enzyme
MPVSCSSARLPCDRSFYTHWPDTFNHQLFPGEYDEMIRGDFRSSGAKRFLACYRRLDGFLASVRRDFPEANILVVSDHGVGTGFKYWKRVLQHVNGCPGIFLAHGPDIRGGDGARHVVSMYDIAPTVLAYFGAPVPEDFRGSVLQAMFKPRLDYPSIRSYRGWPNERVGSSAPPPAENIEPLRTLGYIK